MTATAASQIDEARVEQFMQRTFGRYVDGMVTLMIDLGYRTGLFEAAAAGPATSEGLAERAGLQERYVREWLGSMVTAAIFEYDAATGTYTLPLEHAVCLTGDGANNAARMSLFESMLGKHVDAVVEAFRHGGGVPYSEFRPEFTDVMDKMSRNIFDDALLDGILPIAEGLTELLQSGARVADVGCGTGHALVVLGRAFPASTFVGYDLSEEAIERGRKEVAEAGLANVSYELQDVARLTVDEPFDAVVSFDTIHDQVDPAAVLAHIHAALVPGGTYLMVEPHVSSNLEDNVGNPFAPLVYAVSTLHCMTISLAHGGAGLGTAFGEQKARQLLADAGFGDVHVQSTPADPLDAVYVTHKPA